MFLSISQAMILWGRGEDLTNLMKAIEKYVLSVHPHAISQMNASGTKNGKWKTRIGSGKDRRDVIRRSREELIKYLFDYYTNALATVNIIFDRLIADKVSSGTCKDKTIDEDKRRYDRFIRNTALGGMKVADVDRSDIEKWITSEALPTNIPNKDKPRYEDFKRAFAFLKNIFDESIASGIRLKPNPTVGFMLSLYSVRCRQKNVEESYKEFSKDEVRILQNYFLNGNAHIIHAL